MPEPGARRAATFAVLALPWVVWAVLHVGVHSHLEQGPFPATCRSRSGWEWLSTIGCYGGRHSS
jgi:hypothetical protein